MVSADEDMPVRGSGKGRGKAEPSGKKAQKRSSKPRQKAEVKADQLPETQALEAQELETQELIQELVQEPIDTPVAPAESSPIETPVIETPVIETAVIETAAIDIAPVEPPMATQPAPSPAPAGYQAVTNAYGDYTRKSIEQTSSFFEQIAGARSFNRAFQLQAEYAQRAYETFVAESRRIGDLHRELTLQRMKRLEGLVTGTKATGSK